MNTEKNQYRPVLEFPKEENNKSTSQLAVTRVRTLPHILLLRLKRVSTLQRAVGTRLFTMLSLTLKALEALFLVRP